MTEQNGYATTFAILSLAALSILASAATGPDIQAGVRLRVEETAMAKEAALEEAASEVLEALADDPTPQADSLRDPVWNLVDASRSDGITLTLEDLSTGLNLNTIDPAWLRDPSLTIALAGTGSAGELYEQRLEAFFRTPDEAAEFVPEDTIGTLFSLYGYANPNTTDAETLFRCIEQRLGNAEAAAVLSSDLAAGARAGILYGNDVDRILGSHKERIAPVTAPVPMINVNMAGRELLEAVLSFPYDDEGLEEPSQALDGLMLDKLAGEVFPSDILARVDTEEGGELVHSFLGTTTWFWKLTAENEEGITLSVTAARLPNLSGDDAVRFRVVEKVWGKTE